MKKTAIIPLLLCMLCTVAHAQNTLRITTRNGAYLDIPLAEIEHITLAEGSDGEKEEEKATIEGSWLWGSQREGYYELLAFNADHTFTSYDYYFIYGFDSNSYGTYLQTGSILNLRTNMTGYYGYTQLLQWMVTGLTSHSLSVMTKMGNFTYYRVQKDTLYLKKGEVRTLPDAASIAFADGIVVTAQGPTITALQTGITYITVNQATTGKTLAYRLVVE